MARPSRGRNAAGHDDWPSYSRITIRETPDGLGIYNPARRNVPMILFLLLWLGGWSVGEYFAISTILQGAGLFGDMFLLFWVTFWTVGGAFCWWMVLWGLFGSERLFVTGGALVRSVGLGPLRWRRMFPAGAVANLRIDPAGEASTDNALAPGIAFEIDGSTRRFGVGMDRSELEATLAALRRTLPEASTSLPRGDVASAR